MAEEKKIPEAPEAEAEVLVAEDAAVAEVETSTAEVELSVAEAEVAPAEEAETASEPATTIEEVAEATEDVAPAEETAEATEEAAPTEETVEATEEAAPAEETAEATEEAAPTEEIAEATEEAAPAEEEPADISDKLLEAKDNIARANADARARRNEQEKIQKKTDEEAKARIEEVEKQHEEEEKRARIVAEQKLAALDYAENYRQKLLKDKQKTLNAAKMQEKAEREAAEAATREARAREIAEQLEREREEARARGNRATELLNRVTKCAVVDENGNLRIIDKSEIAKARIEEAKETLEAIKRETSEAQAPAATPKVEPAKVEKTAPVCEKTVEMTKEEAAAREVEEFLLNESIGEDDDSILVNVGDDKMIITLTSEDDPSIAPATDVQYQFCREMAIARAQHEYLLGAIKYCTDIARVEVARLAAYEQKRFLGEMAALREERLALAEAYARRREIVLTFIGANSTAGAAAIAEGGAVLETTEETATTETETVALTPATEEESFTVAESDGLVENYLESAVIATAIADQPAALEVEEPVAEEPVADTAEATETAAETDEPTVETYNDPAINAVKEFGKTVKSRRQLKKYFKRSKKVEKKLNKAVAAIENGYNGVITSPTDLIETIILSGKILELGCDNLSVAAEFGKAKYIDRYADSLFADIDKYNAKIAAYAAMSGEELTRVSSFLPNYLATRTGTAVIPVISYKARYEEEQPVIEDDNETTYTFLFPSVDDMNNGGGAAVAPTVTKTKKEKLTNEVTVKTPIKSNINVSEELGEVTVSGKKDYKQLCKKVKRINKRIDKELKKLSRLAETADVAVQNIALERERVLLYSYVLVASKVTGKRKIVDAAKKQLIEVFQRYNQCAYACAEITGAQITRISAITAENILSSGLLPEVPGMLHVVELFEIVGDTKRLIGEREAEENLPAGSFTFIFGGNHGYVAAAPAPAAVATPAPIAVAAPAAEAIAAVAPAAVSEEAACVETEGELVTVDESAIVYDKRELKRYFKTYNDSVKQLKKYVDELEKLRSVCFGYDEIEIVVNVLSAQKEIIDLSTDALALACKANAKGYKKCAKKNINRATKKYNKYVKQYQKLTGEKLTKASKTTAKDVIRGVDFQVLPVLSFNRPDGQPTAIDVERPETAKTTEIYGDTPVYAAQANAGRVLEIAEPAADPQPAAALYCNQKELKKYFKTSAKRVKASKKWEKDINKQKKNAAGNDRIELTVASLTAKKELVDEYSENLVYASVSENKSLLKKTKKNLNREIKGYNSVVKEYNKLTGKTLTPAPTNIADSILAGQSYTILPKIEYRRPETDATAEAYTVSENSYDNKVTNAIKVSGKKELAKLISKNEREVENIKKELKNIERQKNNASGRDRVAHIVGCLTNEKQIIDIYADTLIACRQVGSNNNINRVKKELAAEIKAYNAYVTEFEQQTGDYLTHARADIVTDIIEGRPYQAIPTISYEVGNFSYCYEFTGDGDDPVTEENLEKIADAARHYNLVNDTHKTIARARLENRIVGQANKDLKKVAALAEYQISLLESERDIEEFRYGQKKNRSNKQFKEIAKEIRAIKKENKAAIASEDADNKRYYSVIFADPATANYTRKNANRDKLASLRTKIMALLNERDIINGQLISIYTGSEVDITGIGINQKWRSVKTDAARESQKKLRSLEQKVKRLPATPAEKDKLFDLMNKQVDGESTIAVLKTRLKKEKDLPSYEKNQLKRDIARNEKYVHQVKEDIKWLIDRIIYRNTDSASSWGIGFVIILVVIVAVLGVFGYIFRDQLMQIFNTVSDLFK